MSVDLRAPGAPPYDKEYTYPLEYLVKFRKKQRKLRDFLLAKLAEVLNEGSGSALKYHSQEQLVAQLALTARLQMNEGYVRRNSIARR